MKRNTVFAGDPVSVTKHPAWRVKRNANPAWADRSRYVWCFQVVRRAVCLIPVVLRRAFRDRR